MKSYFTLTIISLIIANAKKNFLVETFSQN